MYHPIRILLAASSCALLSACNGTIMLTPLPKDQIDQQPPAVQFDLNPRSSQLDQGYPGVIVYLSKPMVEQDRYTQIQVLAADKKTLVLSNNCDKESARSTLTKISQVADRNHPFLLHYKAGLLEGYTFAATLNADGTLASINTTSTPDQGKTVSSLLTAVAAVAPLAVMETAEGAHELPPCTQTPVFDRYLGSPK